MVNIEDMSVESIEEHLERMKRETKKVTRVSVSHTEAAKILLSNNYDYNGSFKLDEDGYVIYVLSVHPYMMEGTELVHLVPEKKKK